MAALGLPVVYRALTLRQRIPGRDRTYSVQSVQGWFRVLRTMTRDALEDLRLDRDPTRRISFPETPEPEHSNSLTGAELSAFLQAMRDGFPQHYGLTVLLAYTGLRFCHGSALRWDDWDQDLAILRVSRKQVRGKVGPISRKKRAPREYPVEPDLASVLREHRAWMVAHEWSGHRGPWMFPNSIGGLRTQSSVAKAWKRCLDAAGITRRFTLHGLRYTFTDLVREADVDPVVRRALTDHVTERMQQHYSHVRIAEKRDAVRAMHQLAPLPGRRSPAKGSGGDFVGTQASGKPLGTKDPSKSLDFTPPGAPPTGGDFGGDPTRKEKWPAAVESLTGRYS